MALSVKCLQGKHENLTPTSETTQKSWACGRLFNPSAGGRNRHIPGTCWPVSYAFSLCSTSQLSFCLKIQDDICSVAQVGIELTGRSLLLLSSKSWDCRHAASCYT